MLDPTDVVFQNSDAKAFTESHNAALKLPEDVITPLPTQSKTAAPARWFITILDCQRWLTDDSILQQPNFCDVLHPVIGYVRESYLRQMGHVVGSSKSDRWDCEPERQPLGLL